MNTDAIIRRYGRENFRLMLACGTREALEAEVARLELARTPDELDDVFETIDVLHGTLRPLSDDDLAKVTGGTL